MEKNIVKISIIIPAYNVEKYIERCLDSIFKQKYSNYFEVIVVDDCSTDKTKQKIFEYKKKYKELKIIEHEKNKKLSKTRKSGIENSTGQYVMHIDSDDWIMPGSLEIIYKEIIQSKADVYVYNYIFEDEYNILHKKKLITEEKITTKKDEVKNLFHGAVWNKIVKRELLNSIIYGEEEINSTEDLIYCAEILLKAKNISLKKEEIYVYCKNDSSITMTVTSMNYLISQEKVLIEMKKIFQTYGVEEKLKENYIKYLMDKIIYEYAKIKLLNKDECKNIELDVIINKLKNNDILTNENKQILDYIKKNKFKLYLTIIKRLKLITAIWFMYCELKK